MATTSSKKGEKTRPKRPGPNWMGDQVKPTTGWVTPKATRSQEGNMASPKTSKLKKIAKTSELTQKHNGENSYRHTTGVGLPPILFPASGKFFIFKAVRQARVQCLPSITTEKKNLETAKEWGQSHLKPARQLR